MSRLYATRFILPPPPPSPRPSLHSTARGALEEALRSSSYSVHSTEPMSPHRSATKAKLIEPTIQLGTSEGATTHPPMTVERARTPPPVPSVPSESFRIRESTKPVPTLLQPEPTRRIPTTAITSFSQSNEVLHGREAQRDVARAPGTASPRPTAPSEPLAHTYIQTHAHTQAQAQAKARHEHDHDTHTHSPRYPPPPGPPPPGPPPPTPPPPLQPRSPVERAEFAPSPPLPGMAFSSGIRGYGSKGAGVAQSEMQVMPILGAGHPPPPQQIGSPGR